MKSSYQKIISIFVLIFFLFTVFMSLNVMVYMSDGHIMANCPLSTMTGRAACPQNMADMVFNHMSAFTAFLNIVFNLSFFSILFSLLLIYFLYDLSKYLILFYRNDFVFFFNDFGRYIYSKIKIISWLSLFENSPSPILL